MRHEILRYLLLVLPYVFFTTLAALIIWGEDMKKWWPRLTAYSLIASLTQTLTYQVDLWQLQFPLEVVSGFLVAWLVFRQKVSWIFKIYASTYVIGIVYVLAIVAPVSALIFRESLGIIGESPFHWLTYFLPAYALLFPMALGIKQFPGIFASIRLTLGTGLEKPYPVFVAIFIQMVLLTGLYTEIIRSPGMDGNDLKALATATTSIILVFISFYLVISYYKRQSRGLMVSSQETVSEQIMDLVNTVRGQRHDLLNQLQILYGLAYEDKTTEIKEYLDDLIPEVSMYSELLKMDNPVISALINAKISQANSKGVEIDVDVTADLNGLGGRVMEISRILANLIDNAVDSVLEEDVLKKVNISISEQGNLLVCQVRNASNKAIDKESIFKPGFTSHEDHSGLGLYNCRKLAEKLGGKVEVGHEDEMVTFVLIVPKKGLWS